MIKNVIFDCGGVLTNCVPFEYVKALGLSKEMEEELSNVIYNSKIWEKSDYGMYKTQEDMIEAFVEENPSYEALIRKFFSPGWMMFYYPFQIGQNFLIKLREEGYKIYILSNYAAEGFAYCENTYDCFKYIDGKVVSADVGVIKPDPRIYKILLEKYNLNPEECIFLDDRERNCEGARKVGIKSIVYKHNVDEIYKIIKSYDKD
ncbi:MAG: HAD family phosphatase [Bacilli bacterium]|nr:HAD family phosphatase [Bacilli bacterium]